jgi:putative transposase
MKANQATWPIATMARLLEVSASGFYAWRGRKPSAHARSDADLLSRIQAIHTRSRGTYGMPRIHAELAGQGIHVGRKRIARLMRIAGLRGVSRRRWITTTRRKPDARPAPDLVQRHFSADAPDRLWVADATYVPTGEGFLYLAVVLDVFSRRIVGWAMSSHLYTELMLRALDMALSQRRPDGVIHHSDSNNVSTSFSTARPVTAVVGLPEGLVPRSVPDGLTHTLIDLICCLSLDPSAGREHRTARFHLAAACDPRRA